MAVSQIYTVDAPDVFATLETNLDGLSPAEAQARLALYGPNTLREAPPPPVWRKLLGHLTHFMALLLWGAGGLAILGGSPLIGVVIWLVVCINAAFSFWQEHRAERAVAALKHVLPKLARVRRGGQETKLASSELVPGDILVLAEGDNVPADARIVEEYGLRVNQAALTGEASPARKAAHASIRDGLSEIERPNLIFAGSSIVSGTGRAVVYATGMLTQFGRIASLTQNTVEGPSPLQHSIQRITRIIALGALGLGLVIFLNAIFDLGVPLLEAFILAVGIIVAAMPEGLRPTITLSLAMAVQNLAGRGVLVKKLAAIETLGATSVICTDKSGTLTQNQMTIREVWVGGQRLAVDGVGYRPEGRVTPSPHRTACEPDWNQLMAAAYLCNNARLTPPSDEQPKWACLGDQTEAALKVLAIKGGVDERTLSAGLIRIHELPFDARRKRMSTIHRVTDPATGAAKEVAFVKGAPREVLQLCTHLSTGGTVTPLTESLRAQIMAANDDYARSALRVLALAKRVLPPRSATSSYAADWVERELIFLGLVAMMDPARPEVAAAIRTCREAGIRIVMITGDYGLTAESLGRRVGIITTGTPRILTGAEVETLSDGELQTAIDGEVVCARMAPEHKLRLVAAFQARGEVVAVTGDGVNDAPALRKADIGIAMGLTGTDVAKEAADVILTDDNFAAIVHAIAEGRAVYDNLRKFITYIFASNIPEILPFILTAVFNIPLALSVAQILAIDLGTDLLPALALGTEKPEPNVMKRPPRRRDQPWLDSGLLVRAFLWLGVIEAALCYVGYFGVYYLHGYTDLLNLPRVDWLPYAEQLATPEGRVYLLANTVFLAGMVMAQIGNAFACRTEKEKIHRLGRWGWLSNPFLLLGIGVEILVMLLLIYFPPLAQAFEHLPLPSGYWLGLAAYAPILYGLDRMRKSIVRRADQFRLRAPVADRPMRS